jgi:serine/threonine protein kinase
VKNISLFTHSLSFFDRLGSLDTLLFDQDQELSDESKIQLVRGIAAGMFHLHKYNIVHRDLAARNILLTANGTPKISVLLFIPNTCSFHFISFHLAKFLRYGTLYLLLMTLLKSFCRTLGCRAFLKERWKERLDLVIQTI